MLRLTFITAAAVAVLVALMVCDLKNRLLPNRLVAAYALLFLAGIYFSEVYAPHGVVAHLAAGAVSFVALFVLFLVGAIGGGDVKLGATVFLWAGSSLALQVALIVTWAGAGLAILGWLLDRRSAGDAASGLRYLLSARRGVPYGVALALGGIFVVWQQLLRGP